MSLNWLKGQHTNTPNDAELVEKYRSNGDLIFVSELFNRYIDFISAITLKYFKNEADAQDNVMEIYEKLIKDVKRHDITYFKSWLFIVCKNHCLKKLKKINNGIVDENISDKIVEIGVPVDLMEEDKMEQHLNNLEICINELPELQRHCVELFYLQKKRYKEIEELTGYALIKVKSYIQNGKRNLKKCILSKNG